jgi:hypothetical protein
MRVQSRSLVGTRLMERMGEMYEVAYCREAKQRSVRGRQRRAARSEDNVWFCYARASTPISLPFIPQATVVK